MHGELLLFRNMKYAMQKAMFLLVNSHNTVQTFVAWLPPRLGFKLLLPAQQTNVIQAMNATSVTHVLNGFFL